LPEFGKRDIGIGDRPSLFGKERHTMNYTITRFPYIVLAYAYQFFLIEKEEPSKSDSSTAKPHMATCAVCSERILIPQQGTVLEGVPVCGRCQGARQAAQDEDADAG